MKVTTVDMYSANFEEPISFSLQNVNSKSRYMIRTILGLDAMDIVPKFYGFGLNTQPTLQGHKFYDLGLKPRDIVIRIVLNPRIREDESVSDIRDELYRAVSATRTGQVVLHFKSGPTIVSRIYGFITKFEVPYFMELPEVQITINCNDPIFRAVNPVLFTPAELPTTNPINIPDSLSTAPHGFVMQVTFKSVLPAFTIQDVPTSPEWKFKIMPSGGFAVGDTLFLSSEFSDKYLYMVRSGVTTQLVDRIEPTSIWPIIFPGQNSFHFPDLASINWNFLQYYAAYWGV